MKFLISSEPIEGFVHTVEAAGCYCEWEGKILLCKRHPQKSEGNTWGIPGGKLEINETPKLAVIREVFEEVGLNINDEGLECIGKLYCQIPYMNFIFHIFRKPFLKYPKINLALQEHIEAKWLTVAETQNLPLIKGGIEALNFYTKQTSGHKP